MRQAARVAATVVLVLAVGVGAFLLARSGGSTDPPDRPVPEHTFVVGDRTQSCETLDLAYVTASVDDATTATFVVDGAEVASGRRGGDQRGPTEITGLLPPSVTDIHCDQRGTHRVEVFTDNPDGCRLAAAPYATFDEWRNHAVLTSTVAVPPGTCSLTIRY